jgi:phage terminase large subunit-like protein
VLEPRGAVAIKGKGEMETWYLVGPRGTDATVTGTESVTEADTAARRVTNPAV